MTPLNVLAANRRSAPAVAAALLLINCVSVRKARVAYSPPPQPKLESGALLRQLVRRGLIAVVQRGDASQREVAYGTTPRFLELFNLRSVEDLPQTQDLQRL